MANVSNNVRQIRQAVYGRDVRESIASGIEAINAEVENTTSRQDVIDVNEDQRKRNEINRINKENERQKSEETRIQNETNRQVDHDVRQEEMLKDHEENQKKMKDEFTNNENSRQNIFNSREEERERWYSEFRNWYNEQSIKGRFPVNLDGGYFGEDDSSDNIYDCGYFGD